jgi:hypothetical protein
VAQGIGPEFKSQYCKKNNRKKKVHHISTCELGAPKHNGNLIKI